MAFVMKKDKKSKPKHIHGRLLQELYKSRDVCDYGMLFVRSSHLSS